MARRTVAVRGSGGQRCPCQRLTSPVGVVVFEDYGFNCLRLSDDWQGADLIACQLDGNTYIKLQLTGGLSIDGKYIGKNVYIAFNENDQWDINPYDKLRDELLDMGLMSGTVSWE